MDLFDSEDFVKIEPALTLVSFDAHRGKQSQNGAKSFFLVSLESLTNRALRLFNVTGALLIPDDFRATKPEGFSSVGSFAGSRLALSTGRCSTFEASPKVGGSFRMGLIDLSASRSDGSESSINVGTDLSERINSNLQQNFQESNPDASAGIKKNPKGSYRTLVDSSGKRGRLSASTRKGRNAKLEVYFCPSHSLDFSFFDFNDFSFPVLGALNFSFFDSLDLVDSLDLKDFIEKPDEMWIRTLFIAFIDELEPEKFKLHRSFYFYKLHSHAISIYSRSFLSLRPETLKKQLQQLTPTFRELGRWRGLDLARRW